LAIQNSPRYIALNALIDTDEGLVFADHALHESFRSGGLSKKDRALATQLVMGTLRYRNRLDWIVGQVSGRRMPELPTPIRNILRLGAFQMLELSRIPDYAAINESVELAKRFGHRGTVSLVNAILRKLTDRNIEVTWPEDDAEYISVRYSHPKWLVDRWLETMGRDETVALCKYNNEPAKPTLRVNEPKVTVDKLRSRLQSVGIACTSSDLVLVSLRLDRYVTVDSLPGFSDGDFVVQDESSTLISNLVAAKESELLVDLCAAPGGKAVSMAIDGRDKLRIACVDRSLNRLKMVAETIERLSLDSLELVCADGTTFSLAGADGVLVDAPCSGLGTIRRHPDLKWRRAPDKLPELQLLQKGLLDNAASMVGSSGRLVYSTCTLNREENEDVVDWFLSVHPQFELENASSFLPVEVVDDRGCLRTIPHLHSMDGVFAARMIRKKE
jgi:16S rRNA (cytosine967-C5)-methyltransferase